MLVTLLSFHVELRTKHRNRGCDISVQLTPETNKFPVSSGFKAASITSD